MTWLNLYLRVRYSDLQELPLGALRHAQRMLSQAEPESESDEDEDGNGGSDSEPETQDTKGKGKEKMEKVEWNARRRTDIAKRANKHAYVFSNDHFNHYFNKSICLGLLKSRQNGLFPGKGLWWKYRRSWVFLNEVILSSP